MNNGQYRRQTPLAVALGYVIKINKQCGQTLNRELSYTLELSQPSISSVRLNGGWYSVRAIPAGPLYMRNYRGFDARISRSVGL